MKQVGRPQEKNPKRFELRTHATEEQYNAVNLKCDKLKIKISEAGRQAFELWLTQDKAGDKNA